MKKILVALAVILLVPWFSIYGKEPFSCFLYKEKGEIKNCSENHGVVIKTDREGHSIKDNDTIKTGRMENGDKLYYVLLSAGGSRLLEDYLPGVILCQIPREQKELFQNEILWECQAVIARTYIRRLMGERTSIHEEELDLDYAGGWDKSSVFRKDDMLQGLERAERAAAATKGKVLKYQNEYILPLFHEMSAGQTRKGAEEFPYLQSVSCPADPEQEDFEEIFIFTQEDFAKRMTRITDEKALTADVLAEGIQTVKKDEAGYMEQMQIGASLYTGDEIRYSLGLPSSHFNMDVTGDQIVVTVQGKGHGYGLSQTAAAALADQGWELEDILTRFYPDVEVVHEENKKMDSSD